ncbi:hypothetical protein [Streptomyces sp. NPDC048442]|uniref:hypothetical protein n=1 Tax=Streptomyces sp. NPDC048442 TaxID=3154823 RepID=UPI00342E2360
MNLRAKEILDLSATATAALISRLPDGQHAVVCADGGAEFVSSMEFSTLVGLASVCPDCTMEFASNLACVIASGQGGLVVRTHVEGKETVRGWNVTPSGVDPVSESVTYSAYTTDAVTGEFVPPEDGVTYAAGFSLSPPEA